MGGEALDVEEATDRDRRADAADDGADGEDEQAGAEHVTAGHDEVAPRRLHGWPRRTIVLQMVRTGLHTPPARAPREQSQHPLHR